ncbi:MAG: MCE family protein [Deltaproteobacteria bacterium]|nr:MCE family protein [Deltaproteobacteria bacterium]
MRSRFLTPFNVGLLTLAGVGFFIYGLSASKKGLPSGTSGYQLHAFFDDASGLSERTRVMTAGILVGEVEKIELVGTKAKITFRVRRDFKMHEDASLAKRQSSFIGGYYIDVRSGSATKPLLADGQTIANVDTSGMFDAIRDEARSMTVKLNKVIEDVGKVTGSLSSMVGDPETGGTIKQMLKDAASTMSQLSKTVADSSGRFERILRNFDRFAGQLAGLASRSGGQAERILSEFHGVVVQVRDFIKSSSSKIGSNLGSVDHVVGGLKDSTDSLKKAMSSLSNVLQKVEGGEGAVGKLVGDKKMGDRVERIAERVEEAASNTSKLVKNVGQVVGETSDIIGKLTRLQAIVDARGEYNVNAQNAKTYVGLRIQPKEDKFLRFQLVVDPRRNTTTESIVRRNTSTVSGAETITEEVERTTDSLKFSAEIAKRWGPLTLRGGLVENTGGFGLDLSFLRDRVTVNTDLFNLKSGTRPRLKTTAGYTFLRHFTISGGVDDILNSATRDYFVGAGLTFTDDDLKSLLLVAPVPK